jgi:hypothetical protein
VLFPIPHFPQHPKWNHFLTPRAVTDKDFAIYPAWLYKTPLLSTTAAKDDAAVRRAVRCHLI